MGAAAIVQTHNLTKNYGGTNRVNKIGLQVAEGEIYGFLGPNGAGKTTTLKMLLGLIKPSEGAIKIFGEDLNENRPSILKRTGSLIESPSYYGHLTGLENMRVMQKQPQLTACWLRTAFLSRALKSGSGRSRISSLN